MTGNIQPLDIHINGWLKQEVVDETDRIEEEMENAPSFIAWTLALRRILTTKVAEAVMDMLYQNKQEMVQKSFKDTGIAVVPDGSEDDKISIKCFSSRRMKPDISS
jgi:hypothetical protein